TQRAEAVDKLACRPTAARLAPLALIHRPRRDVGPQFHEVDTRAGGRSRTHRGRRATPCVSWARRTAQYPSAPAVTIRPALSWAATPDGSLKRSDECSYRRSFRKSFARRNPSVDSRIFGSLPLRSLTRTLLAAFANVPPRRTRARNRFPIRSQG